MGGYWWQEENRGQRTLRLVTQLAVDLGRLPTFEEAQAYEEGLPSDAAFYYSSYSALCRRVAGRLYGSEMRTYPTEQVKLCGLMASRVDSAEELQAAYTVRLEKLGLAPKDPQRLTEPAPTQELLVGSRKKPVDGVMAGLRPEAREVMEQILMQAPEIAEQLENTEIDMKEVRIMAGKQTSPEICREAVRQAYAAIGENAFIQKSYREYASKHGLPAILTIEKKFGIKQRDWRKLLEDSQDAPEIAESALEVPENVPEISDSTPEVSEGELEASEKVPEVSEGAPEVSECMPEIPENDQQSVETLPKVPVWGNNPGDIEEHSEASRGVEKPDKPETPDVSEVAGKQEIQETEVGEVIEYTVTGTLRIKTKRDGQLTTIKIRLGED